MHKITGNQPSAVSRNSHSYMRNTLCGPVYKSWMPLMSSSVVYMILSSSEKYVNLNIFSAVKLCKNSVAKNCFHKPLYIRISCVPMYAEFLTDLFKKFQAAYTDDTDVEYKILSFCYSLFLSYADNRHPDKHPNTQQTDTQTHSSNAKNVIFGFGAS